eukprot:862646-Pyramimonas_sp.AAC.1
MDGALGDQRGNCCAVCLSPLNTVRGASSGTADPKGEIRETFVTPCNHWWSWSHKGIQLTIVLRTISNPHVVSLIWPLRMASLQSARIKAIIRVRTSGNLYLFGQSQQTELGLRTVSPS